MLSFAKFVINHFSKRGNYGSINAGIQKIYCPIHPHNVLKIQRNLDRHQCRFDLSKFQCKKNKSFGTYNQLLIHCSKVFDPFHRLTMYILEDCYKKGEFLVENLGVAYYNQLTFQKPWQIGTTNYVAFTNILVDNLIDYVHDWFPEYDLEAIIFSLDLCLKYVQKVTKKNITTPFHCIIHFQNNLQQKRKNYLPKGVKIHHQLNLLLKVVLHQVLA